MAYYCVDDSGYREHETLDVALQQAKNSIEMCRSLCDPEWPDSVQYIEVYEAPPACEYPEEDGKLLYRSFEVLLRDGREGEAVDYWCDYEMRAAPTEGEA